MVPDNSESTNKMVITGLDHSNGRMQIACSKFHLQMLQTTLETRLPFFICKQYWTQMVLSDTALNT